MRIVIDFPGLPDNVEYRVNAENIFQVFNLAAMVNTTQAETVGNMVALNPPTAEEVKTYANSIGYDIDAEEFIAHYDSVGWQRAEGQPYKAWQPLVIRWRKNRGRFAPTYTKDRKSGVKNSLIDWARSQDEKNKKAQDK